MTRLLCVLIALFLAGCSSTDTHPRWSKIELTFDAPESAKPLDVTFTSPDKRTFRVPGFHAGDDTWKARFSADQNGPWTWRTLDGISGAFTVTDPPADAPDLYRWGRLEYADNRYLKFREGSYWLKAGADEPENLLGDIFGRDNWEAKKRQIDYLASTGVNSVYIMTHNLEGDSRDVWPWLGGTEEEAKLNPTRFDNARLERWRDLFEHIQSRGLVIQLVLEDDSAWTGHDYALYYREMVARFGDLPAIYFNYCEEYNEAHSLEEALSHMELLASIDPYDHPRAIHNVNLPVAAYIDSPAVQVASIQTDPSKPATLNQRAIEWFSAPLARRKRPLVISFDEARPAEDRRSWWAVFLGGGIWEGILKVENHFNEYETEWRELAGAREFMESLPFQEMYPANHLVAGGQAFCLAKPPDNYALYLVSGGEIQLDLIEGNTYQVEWYDPRGQAFAAGPEEIAGGRVKLTAPDNQDWAVRIHKTAGDEPSPPTAFSARIVSSKNEPVGVYLAALPAAEALSYEIVTAPSHGTVAGAGPDRTYTPNRGFTGEDRFQWRTGSSNIATVTIAANATGVNKPAQATNQTVRTRPGEPVTFILRYSDVDGPGPYRVQVRKEPANGSATGLDNDVTYTPNAGFRGRDTIEWTVSDGRSRSNRATATILVRD